MPAEADGVDSVFVAWGSVESGGAVCALSGLSITYVQTVTPVSRNLCTRSLLGQPPQDLHRMLG